MSCEYVHIEQSLGLQGEVSVEGAKNAALVIIASLILTSGKSRLRNIPNSEDIHQMIQLLEELGAHVSFNSAENILEVDTSTICRSAVSPSIMRKMRASILVMGPLLARFGRAQVALPGGCTLGARPIDFHLKAFAKMGAEIEIHGEFLTVQATALAPQRFVLEYPSVGATENIMMAASLTRGFTTILNAALEPEVLDLMNILKAMGARITILPPATIEIEGVSELHPVDYAIIPDRLEAGTLLLAAAAVGGTVTITNAQALMMDLFLEKVSEMGHTISVGTGGIGVTLTATAEPRAVSFKTMPYPGFPTDLQAQMMGTLVRASGMSVIHETVFENRLMHVRELEKMGAHIAVHGTTATVTGVDELFGAHVTAPDIRAASALIIAGLTANGVTTMTGIHHLRRGYGTALERKLALLGAKVSVRNETTAEAPAPLRYDSTDHSGRAGI